MKCGVVDLGSNTVRLSIYDYSGTGFQRLLNEKAMVGLAGHVKDGAITQDGIRSACRVLAAYRALLDNFGVTDMHVFATASLRNISNTTPAVAAILAATGIDVEVLSGDDEARLSFRGAISDPHSTGLLTDIGGGSTELVTYENGVITSACSLPMGSLSLYAQHVSGLFPLTDESRAMGEAVALELGKAKTVGMTRTHLLGVGGTLRAASRLANDTFSKDPDCHSLTAQEVIDLYRRLKAGDRDTLQRILRATPDRVHTILPGLIILCGIVRAYGVENIDTSADGVREGYLLERIMGL